MAGATARRHSDRARKFLLLFSHRYLRRSEPPTQPAFLALLNFPALKAMRGRIALIGSPELFSNRHNASSTLAIDWMPIVNNSAAPGGDLFTAWPAWMMKIWRSGRSRICRTNLSRIVWRSFGPSAFSEPDELLAKGAIKSHCKYFTVLGFPPQTIKQNSNL